MFAKLLAVDKELQLLSSEFTSNTLPAFFQDPTKSKGLFYKSIVNKKGTKETFKLPEALFKFKVQDLEMSSPMGIDCTIVVPLEPTYYSNNYWC